MYDIKYTVVQNKTWNLSSPQVEVYRSKSVGHEPSADETASRGQGGDVNASCVGMGMEIGMEMGIGAGVGDTNVKIHLEVLEICDNEEAMDSVSIISNISQSSTHARSPSLRYSRRENRFVSCDLGETASYSLLIPSSGTTEAETINITIPDTVEAHRQNSRRQTQESSGYHEEIQLLNEAYRKQAGEREEWNTYRIIIGWLSGGGWKSTSDSKGCETNFLIIPHLLLSDHRSNRVDRWPK